MARHNLIVSISILGAFQDVHVRNLSTLHALAKTCITCMP